MIILNAGNEVGRFACENLATMLWCCAYSIVHVFEGKHILIMLQDVGYI
jgi:hypothetical protein